MSWRSRKSLTSEQIDPTRKNKPSVPALIDMSGENTIHSHYSNVCMPAACHRLHEMNRYAKQQGFFIAAYQECYQSNVLTKRKFLWSYRSDDKHNREHPPKSCRNGNIGRWSSFRSASSVRFPWKSWPASSVSSVSIVEDPHLSVRARVRETGIPQDRSNVSCGTICKRIHSGRKFCKCSPKRIRRCDRHFARKFLRFSKTMQLSSISSSLYWRS